MTVLDQLLLETENEIFETVPVIEWQQPGVIPREELRHRLLNRPRPRPTRQDEIEAMLVEDMLMQDEFRFTSFDNEHAVE